MSRLNKLLKKYGKYLLEGDRKDKITLQSTYYGYWCCVIDSCTCATRYFTEVEWDVNTIGIGDTPEEALVEALKNYGIKNPNVR